MGTILQYSHTSDAPFDFNDKNAKAGFHRLGTENSFKNAPSGVNPVYSNVLVVRNNAWDTLSMTIYLYTKGTNSSVVYKTGNTTDWANLSWSVYATKSDLPKYDIKTFTVDVTTQNANSNGKYYTEKKLSTESWYSSAKAIVPLFARKSGGAYLCMAEIEYETLRVQADIAISGVTVGILVVS